MLGLRPACMRWQPCRELVGLSILPLDQCIGMFCLSKPSFQQASCESAHSCSVAMMSCSVVLRLPCVPYPTSLVPVWPSGTHARHNDDTTASCALPHMLVHVMSA